VRSPSPLRIDAGPAVVEAAAVAALGARADGGGHLRVPSPPGRQVPIDVGLELRADGTGTAVALRAEPGPAIPFFGRFFRPLVALARRRAVAHTAAALEAAVAHAPPPPAPRSVLGLPPVPFEDHEIRLLATAAAATAVVSFSGALFGQLSGPISEAFSASDAQISGALSLTRAGALIALVLSSLADRRGRRRVILVSLVGSAIACVLSAAAPGLAVFTGAQVFQRAFVISAFTVAGIAVIEEAPEGARAYAASMLALAGGFGFSLAVIVLPFGDLGDQGWRIPFVLGFAALVLVPAIGRQLAETSRYRALVGTDAARGSLREVLDRNYRRRFVLLGAAAFLTSMFSAPSSTLMNKYLEDVRDFSSSGVAVFRTVTTAVPGLIGLLVGGRLAETRGRRPVAAIGLAIATCSQMVFFLTGGSIIWVASAVSILAAGASGVALGTMDAELFATEIRGTSNALLTVVGVTGSVAGLMLAGNLSDPMGNLGRSIALTGAAALVAAVFVVPRLPEPRAHALDELSPSEHRQGRAPPAPQGGSG